MIRNMVFDMGRVLLDYDPVGVCRHYTEDESAIEIIRRELFESEECFFIDDLSANIAGAERCGMEGYCFSDGDVGRLRKILRERGTL